MGLGGNGEASVTKVTRWIGVSVEGGADGRGKDTWMARRAVSEVRQS